ncbi:MAG TPA: hypothetical protein VJ884_09340, partial [Salinibacter sp.]|nr:hypothetical protein [Salinibacter sp.]
MLRRTVLLVVPLLVLPLLVQAQEQSFSRMDVFDLEWVEQPRMSPDGDHIVYERRGMDVMDDRRTSHLWIVGADGSG